MVPEWSTKTRTAVGAILLIILSAFLVASLGRGRDNGGATAPTRRDGIQVSTGQPGLDSFPAPVESIEIRAPLTGTVSARDIHTVFWNNRAGQAVSVSSQDGLFHSGRIEPGSSYTFTFLLPGDYPYRVEEAR